MSDEGEIWNAYKEGRRLKRWKNKEQSLDVLRANSIIAVELNASCAHYRVAEYDFWPTTGKWRNQKTGDAGRGVLLLIAKIKGKTNADTRQNS